MKAYGVGPLCLALCFAPACTPPSASDGPASLGEEIKYQQPAEAVVSSLSGAKLIEVSRPPSYGSARDLKKGLLFDGNDKTGYGWRTAYAFPIILLIDLGEGKTFDAISVTALGGNSPFELPFYRVLAGQSPEKMHVIVENHDRDNLPLHNAEHSRFPLTSTFSAIRARYLIVDVKPMGYFAGLQEIEIRESESGESPSGKSVKYEDYYEYEYLGNSCPYPTQRYVTPHIQWAKPLAGGKIKTLALMSFPTSRDIVEIAQRADLDWEFVGTRSNNSKSLDVHVVRKLDNALERPHDVMLIGSTRWVTLPAEIQKKILQKVRGGMGLLYIQPRFTSDNIDAVINSLKPAPEVIAGVPIERVQFLDQPKDPYILKGKFGAGTVVVMQYEIAETTDWWWTPDWVDTWWSACSIMPPILPSPTEPNASCEFAMSAIIRCMMAAGNRDILVPEISVDGDTVSIAASQGAHSAQIVVCDERMRTLTQFTSKIDGRQMEFSLSGKMPSGGNTINCWLRDEQDCVIGWGSRVANVEDTSINNIGIKLKARNLGEEVEGHVFLDPRETRVVSTEIEIRDTYDRVIDHRRETGTTEGFRFSTEKVCGHGVTVTVRIYGEDEDKQYLLDEERVLVPLRVEPDNEDYIFAAWGEYPFMILRPYGVHAWRQSQEMGYDRTIAFQAYWPTDTQEQIQSGYRAFLSPFIENNIRPMLTYVASTGYAVRPHNKKRVQLADEAFYEEFSGRTRHRMSMAKPWNVTDVFWGDETSYWQDKSPAMLERFQEYLKQRHNSLEVLNRSWGTEFGSWADVEPGTFSEVAKRKGSVGQYIEFQGFLEQMMLEYYRHGYQAAQDVIPGVKVGITGTAEPFTLGNDWSLSLEYMDHVIYYGDNVTGIRLTREALRSFGSRESVFYRWTGYDYFDRNEIYARYGIWSDLLYGFDGIAIYAAHGFYRRGYHNHGAINPDFTFTQRGRWHQRESKEIKQGIGKLLCISEHQKSPVGVYYSMESLRAGGMARWLKRSPSNFAIEPAHIANSTFQILADLQFSPNFVDHKRIQEGPGRRVIVLPATFLLSDVEIERLASFVFDGGTLISFGHPAYMTEDGELREGNLLQSVLGSEPRQDFWRTKSDVRRFAIGQVASEIVLADARTRLAGDVSVLLRTSDGLPLVSRNNFGKGNAYFINGFPTEYMAYRPDVYGGKDLDPSSFKEINSGAFRKLLSTCLDDAGIRPAFTIVSGNYPAGVPYLEVNRFANGDVRFNCLIEAYLEHLRTATASKIIGSEDYRPLKINFERKSHVYELRSGRYIGYVDSAVIDVAPTVAQVFALSPERVKDLSVTVDCRMDQVNTEISVVGLENTKYTPVVHVDVYDPEGTKIEPYSKNIVLDPESKSGIYAFEHAINDTKGQWRIVVKDVLSGLTNEAAYELNPQAPRVSRQ